MQPSSDKTFHLKWNNHLQNMSQLFSSIFTSSALTDVTLSCRDGAIRAHKLVLSACSPYFEQIFKDNPCKHPVIILKGIPYAEINLLVEFMYKGSVDVQEIDLQSLMHTASELEVRGLAYELRKDAFNVNLNEYPAYSATRETSSTAPLENRTNPERVQQIHLYQQSVCKSAQQDALGSEAKRKRKIEEPMPANTTTAVKNILAAAAKELAKNGGGKATSSASIQTEEEAVDSNPETFESDGAETEPAPESEEPLHGRDTRFKGKKRVSVGMVDDYPIAPRAPPKNKPTKKNVTVKNLIGKTSDPANNAAEDCEDAISKVIISAVTGGSEIFNKSQGGTLKCVDFSDLRETRENVTVIEDDDSSAVETSDENNIHAEATYESAPGQDDEYDSSDSKTGHKAEGKIYKCDLCGLSYGRKFHMKRHRRTHTGERPFQCDECPFSFSRSSHLARHRRTHTGERPYRCEACGRTFTRGDKLKLHLRICEKDEYVLPSRLNVDDPTKHITKEINSTTMIPGMVSIGHSERHQLMFTPSGDVLLAPRLQGDPMGDVNSSITSDLNESNQSSLMLNDSNLNLSMMGTPSTSEAMLAASQYYSIDASGYPIKRGRGRPRKKPLPIVVPLIKKKRGRPPKIIKLDPNDGTSNRPIENYNASNLPYGDFSYLTDIISTHFNPANQQNYQNMIQHNPILDANKFASLMNAAAQSAAAQSAAASLNAEKHNLSKSSMTLQDIVSKTVSASSLNKNNINSSAELKQSSLVVNTITSESAKSQTMTNSNDINASNVSQTKNDGVIDSTTDRGVITEKNNVKTSSNLELNDIHEQIIKVGECQVSKVPFNTSKKPDGSINNTAIISSIGECTIKPVVRND